jgi:hypothetical protein
LLAAGFNLEYHAIVAVRQHAPFVRAGTSNGTVELEHIITSRRPHGVRGNGELCPVRGHKTAGDRRRRIEVVVHVESVALIAQLG